MRDIHKTNILAWQCLSVSDYLSDVYFDNWKWELRVRGDYWGNSGVRGLMILSAAVAPCSTVH